MAETEKNMLLLVCPCIESEIMPDILENAYGLSHDKMTER